MTRSWSPYLWPIVREIIKTAIENRQDLIVEGCYVPHAGVRTLRRPISGKSAFAAL